MRTLIGMGLLSAAALLLQVALTRVFSIAQFYHFAFLVVSLALLGFGASGSLLALRPRLRNERYSPWYALGFGATTLIAYLLANHFPFDSYSIAWDGRQIYLLLANLLGLAVPFAFAGALIGALLSEAANEAGRIYAANLVGSAGGAVAAPLLIGWLGSERTVLCCAALGMLAAALLAGRERSTVTFIAWSGLAAGLALLAIFPALFHIRPSPYKSLSRMLLDPDTRLLAARQNAYSRLDILASPTIHSAQGLSLGYLGELPPQVGLLVDGDNLMPVSDAARTEEALLRALPAAVAYTIRPQAEVLVLNAGGGMDVLAALGNGARHVTAVEPNNLIYDALTGDLRTWAGLADDPRVTLVHEEVRTFVQQAQAQYDAVTLALVDNYRPISAGAFTLTEDYTLTVEALETYLRMCGEDGLLVITRWLQARPSESLRVLGTAMEALGEREPLQHIVVFRTFQNATFIVRPTPFTAEETAALLEAVSRLRYDLVLAPEMPPEMINRYARVETPVHQETFLALATAENRNQFYAEYPFDVTPPGDDRPFFFHFFRWEQTPEVLENLGRRWQPFGGSGYLVLVALLVFVGGAATVFVVLPIGFGRRFREALVQAGRGQVARTLGYFAAIGLAFLLVEVALIQQHILLLGRPTLAIATVIGALLLFSGLGSAVSQRFTSRYWMVLLALLVVVYPWLVRGLTPLLLPLPLVARVMATALLIAPVGFLMGMPFPRGIAALAGERDLIPWAWAINGSASVVSAVLGATLALSAGFTAVLLAGGGCYLLAAAIRPRV